jgi:hypothetical protein
MDVGVLHTTGVKYVTWHIQFGIISSLISHLYISMEQSTSLQFIVPQNITLIVRYRKADYRVQKSPPMSLSRQINPIHAIPSHFYKIHFNNIFPSASVSSKWSRSFTLFPTNMHLSSQPYVPQAVPILLSFVGLLQVRVMKPTWCTICLRFIQSLYLYMFRAC